jgi:hypothetical protein
MANVLSEEKRQQVLALGRLGWSLSRIVVHDNLRGGVLVPDIYDPALNPYKTTPIA